MARYFLLCALKVQHEFFEGSPESNHLTLRFLPSPVSTEVIRHENLLVRERTNGIEIWQEERETGEAETRSAAITAPSTRELDLTFMVSSSDPHFNFYTDWDLEKPINFSNQGPTGNADVIRLVAQTAQAEDSGLSGGVEKKKNPTLFTVQLRHRIDAKVAHYLIELKARPLHWKYFFSGALAKKKLEIIDLEGNKTQGCQFKLSENAVTTSSVAFISEVPLPMKSMPTQRFQLREEGAAGRVLMRRLPNASIDKVGKERGPNGQSLVVAEIYIHQ